MRSPPRSGTLGAEARVARLETLPALAERAPVAHGAIIEGDWWLAWSYDPGLLILAGLMVACYLRGLRRWPVRTHSHPWWRTALFLAGMATLVLAVESPIDRLGEHHFTLHMVQHELLMMVAVPLILLGAPTTPMLRGLPRWLRDALVRPVAASPAAHRVGRVLTHPAVGISAISVVMWFWHLAPGWYERALLDARIHELEHASFLGAGMLFWWNVIDPHPLRSRIPHLARIFYVFAGAVPKDALAATIVFSEGMLYPSYLTAAPIFPLTWQQDQALGGLIMWIGGDAVHVIAVIAIFLVWYRRMRIEDDAAEAIPSLEPR
ncbi:MAG: cytochrome c oxidase assembly protein [Dehalococcoidia bacterium]|nr:cytochrome c oxidase assembly protein [Dehalococcoidia bacterium]